MYYLILFLFILWSLSHLKDFLYCRKFDQFLREDRQEAIKFLRISLDKGIEDLDLWSLDRLKSQLSKHHLQLTIKEDGYLLIDQEEKDGK